MCTHSLDCVRPLSSKHLFNLSICTTFVRFCTAIVSLPTSFIPALEQSFLSVLFLLKCWWFPWDELGCLGDAAQISTCVLTKTTLTSYKHATLSWKLFLIVFCLQVSQTRKIQGYLLVDSKKIIKTVSQKFFWWLFGDLSDFYHLLTGISVLFFE